LFLPAYSPVYFFQQAGIDTSRSYQIAIGGTSISFVGTLMSWVLITHFGRRTLYLSGLVLDSLVLLLIGVLASVSESAAIKWAQAALCIVWLFVYSSTVGPVCYTIIAETSSLRLRSKSVALARNMYNMAQIVSNIVEPYLINPTEADLKGRAAYVWFGTAALAVLWTFFRLPECGGRTYEELDAMFHDKVPTREFSSWDGDAYENDSTTKENQATDAQVKMR
jgi:SP family general alpha glucoside:H+ symporter-like MFS transporter